MSFVDFRNSAKATQNRNLSVITFIYYNVKIYIYAREKNSYFNKTMLSKINLPIILLLSLTLLMGFEINARSIEPQKIDVSLEIKNLKGKNSTKKLEAIRKLGKSKNKKAANALIKQFKTEKNQYAKARIAESFKYLKGKNIVDEMVEALKSDPSADVRYSAARTLAYASDPAVVPALIEAFLNEKEGIGVRLQAAGSLENHGVLDEIYKCFEKSLENPAPEIRMQAVVSMSRLFGRDKRAKAALGKMIKDKNEKVKKIAERRLEILKGKAVPESKKR